MADASTLSRCCAGASSEIERVAEDGTAHLLVGRVTGKLDLRADAFRGLVGQDVHLDGVREH
eukprot:7838348-Lingulodinium_polyedra.AAC.1